MISIFHCLLTAPWSYYMKSIGGKMTALIDMPKLVKKSTDQKFRSIDNDQILEASIILIRFQFKSSKEKGRLKRLQNWFTW